MLLFGIAQGYIYSIKRHFAVALIIPAFFPKFGTFGLAEYKSNQEVRVKTDAKSQRNNNLGANREGRLLSD